MIRLPALLILVAASAAPPEPQRAVVQRSYGEVTIRQRVIVRIPRLPASGMVMRAASPAPPIRWDEKKTDKCVRVQDLAAASIAGKESVDLLMNGGSRLRARFHDDCRTLDFYSGFYVKMPPDGKLCADRDTIRSRSGGECRIDSFRALVPRR